MLRELIELLFTKRPVRENTELEFLLAALYWNFFFPDFDIFWNLQSSLTGIFVRPVALHCLSKPTRPINSTRLSSEL